MEIETLVDQLDRPEEKSAEEKRREEEAKKEEEDKNPHGQVVDIAKPAIEERPDRANYVSEFDSKVAERSTPRRSSRPRIQSARSCNWSNRMTCPRNSGVPSARSRCTAPR